MLVSFRGIIQKWTLCGNWKTKSVINVTQKKIFLVVVLKTIDQSREMIVNIGSMRDKENEKKLKRKRLPILLETEQDIFFSTTCCEKHLKN